MHKLALWLSGIFSPILVPTYGFVATLWITPLATLPERTRFLTSLVVFLLTAGVPMFTILMLIRAGKVDNADITNRRQRTGPFLVALSVYLLAALYIRSLHAPRWLVAFFVAAMFAVAIAVLINKKWKISAHLTGLGGLTAMFFWIAVNGLGTVMMLPWILGMVLVSGVVASSRVYLGRHTLAQVYAGFALGIAVMFTVLAIAC